MLICVKLDCTSHITSESFLFYEHTLIRTQALFVIADRTRGSASHQARFSTDLSLKVVCLELERSLSWCWRDMRAVGEKASDDYCYLVSSLLAGSSWGLGLPEQSDACHLYFLTAESAAPPQRSSLLGKQTEWIICEDAKNTVKWKLSTIIIETSIQPLSGNSGLASLRKKFSD